MNSVLSMYFYISITLIYIQSVNLFIYVYSGLIIFDTPPLKAVLVELQQHHIIIHIMELNSEWIADVKGNIHNPLTS